MANIPDKTTAARRIRNRTRYVTYGDDAAVQVVVCEAEAGALCRRKVVAADACRPWHSSCRPAKRGKAEKGRNASWEHLFP